MLLKVMKRFKIILFTRMLIKFFTTVHDTEILSLVAFRIAE